MGWRLGLSHTTTGSLRMHIPNSGLAQVGALAAGYNPGRWLSCCPTPWQLGALPVTLDASAVVADVGRKSSLKPSIWAAISREVGRDPGVDISRESCLLTGVDTLACTRSSRKGVSSGICALRA